MIIKNTKHSLTSFIVLTVVGLAGLIYAILVLPQDNYQQGLIYGVTSGFVLTGVIGIIYSIHLMRNPQKAKEVSIQKDEERTQFIRQKTAVSTAQVSLYLEAFSALIIGLMGYKEISMAITALLVIQAIVASAFASYYSKKF
jgi:hypothetical protein